MGEVDREKDNWYITKSKISILFPDWNYENQSDGVPTLFWLLYCIGNHNRSASIINFHFLTAKTRICLLGGSNALN